MALAGYANMMMMMMMMMAAVMAVTRSLVSAVMYMSCTRAECSLIGHPSRRPWSLWQREQLPQPTR